VIHILKTRGEQKYIPAEGSDSGQREVVERASVFVRVNATKRYLAIGIISVAAVLRSEVNTKDFLGLIREGMVSVKCLPRSQTKTMGPTIDRCEYKLSKKVGTKPVPDTVPCVKPTGPKPIIPSTPVNPEAEVAAPKDCLCTVTPPYETGPIFSLPETWPDPYDTAKLWPVLLPQDEETGV
jgi:hypothetical protein